MATTPTTVIRAGSAIRDAALAAALAGIGGLAIGLAGCGLTNSTRDVENSLSAPKGAKQAAPAQTPTGGTQYPWRQGEQTARQQTGQQAGQQAGSAQPASAPLSFTAEASVTTIIEDPFALSTSGLAAGTNTAGPTQRTERSNTDPTAIYRHVMTDALSGKAGDPAKGGGANFAQLSFSQEGADFDPDVSRDGRHIVFASTQHRATSDIYIKSVGSRVVTQLTNDPANDVMPRISPDGTRIAFASNRTGNWDIYIMPIAGGRAVQITATSDVDLHPSWSPDGTQLVFCRLGEVSGQWELWVTEVGNPGIARFIGYGLFPEWCPVGGTGAGGADRIVFQKSRERGDRSFGIWTLDYKNGQAANTTEMASDPAFACINPSWSKDGEWIAYATVPSPSQWNYRTGVKPPSADLWLIDLQGSNRINMTSGRSVNLMPAWGPENRLYFVSDRGGSDNIWSMDTTAVIELAQANARGGTAVAGPSPSSATTPRTAPAPVANVPSGGDGN